MWVEVLIVTVVIIGIALAFVFALVLTYAVEKDGDDGSPITPRCRREELNDEQG